MSAMRASSDDPASLTCETVTVPDPGPGELLVEVHATAVTAAELTWPENWPAIPCHDLSGVVAALGGGVTGWQPGDEVYGLVGFDRPGAGPGPQARQGRPSRGCGCPARRAHRMAGPARARTGAARSARPGPRRS